MLMAIPSTADLNREILAAHPDLGPGELAAYRRIATSPAYADYTVHDLPWLRAAELEEDRQRARAWSNPRIDARAAQARMTRLLRLPHPRDRAAAAAELALDLGREANPTRLPVARVSWTERSIRRPGGLPVAVVDALLPGEQVDRRGRPACRTVEIARTDMHVIATVMRRLDPAAITAAIDHRALRLVGGLYLEAATGTDLTPR